MSQKYDRITEVSKSIDHIEEVQKFNPYHDSRGRFTTGGGGGAGAAAGSGSGEVDQKKWKQNYDKVFNELEKMEAKYLEYDEKYRALDAEVRACRRANDAKGEARAKKKMNKLDDEIYDFEQKLHDKRAQFAEMGNEAYEIGIIW